MNNIENINYNLTTKDMSEIKYAFIFIIILIVIIYKNAFENDNYSCNNIFYSTWIFLPIKR